MSVVRVMSPRVVIPERTWKKLIAYIEACPKEVGGLGTAELVGDDIVIAEVFLLDQKVDEANTDISFRTHAKFVTDWTVSGKDPRLLRVWWHSHGPMRVFWSEKDLKTIRGFSRGNWHVSIVGNHRRETLARISLTDPFPIAIDDVPLVVMPEFDEELRRAAAAEVKAKVKVRRSVPLLGPKRWPEAVEDGLAAAHLPNEDEEVPE